MTKSPTKQEKIKELETLLKAYDQLIEQTVEELSSFEVMLRERYQDLGRVKVNREQVEQMLQRVKEQE